jgi:hypothetical protein
MDFSTPFHSVVIVGCGLSGYGPVSSMSASIRDACAEQVHPITAMPTQQRDTRQRRLYAARLLRKQFPDLICLEANDRIGGRVQHVRPALGCCLV